MANEHDERLRRAEKAVRQGRIDLAIAEYTALVSEQGDDLSSSNTLGDLLVRAGRSPEAVPCYMRVADAYLREGFFSKAAGFYRKVLKFVPGDDVPALRLADALAAQGLIVEAKAQFSALRQARRKRGDADGAEQLLLRIAEIDPQDVAVRLDAARVFVRAGDPRGLEWLQAAAEQLRQRGREAEALDVVRETLAADPANASRRAELVRALLDSGDYGAARGLLSPDVVGQECALLQQGAELELLAGSLEGARTALARWLAADPEARIDVAELAQRLPGLDEQRRFLGVDVVVDGAVAQGDFHLAAAMLSDFVATRAGAVPALLRLIDVCIDGGLDASVVPAQSQLAEAYLSGGALREAQLVAEDLFLRDPRNDTHRASLRRILVDRGEADPDATISALAALGAEDEPATEPAVGPPFGAEAPPTAVATPGTGASVRQPQAAPEVYGLSLSEVEDLEEAAEPLVRPGPTSGTAEVDLTGAMNALSAGPPGVLADVNGDGGDWDDQGEDEGLETAGGAGVPGLEDVFDGIRAKASTTHGVDGRQQLALGRTYLAAGLLDQAVAAFGRAAHDAGVRGSACLALGELFEEQQDYAHAIEWLERGADAPQISDSDRLGAMRRLASVLEAASESARALAVWLEIQTLHPGDREAPARVAKLSATGR